MTNGLANQVAVVTGAGRGIGRATALLLARQGARLVVNDPGYSADGLTTSEDPAREVVREIESLGGRAVANFASVADWEGARSIIATALDAFGRIDALVNTAGLTGSRKILELEPDEFHRIVGSSLTGTFNCIRHAAPHFMAQGSGRIVNFVSRAGLVGIAGATAYAAAKGGVFGLTNSLARELAPHGVLVNAVNPAATQTRMVVGDEVRPSADNEQLRRMLAVIQPTEHVALVTGYLCSTACQMAGQYLLVHRDGVSLLGSLSPMAEIAFSEAEWTFDEVALRVGQVTPNPLSSVY